jgi:hypothetical protein
MMRVKTWKEQFVICHQASIRDLGAVTKIVVAVRLPTGATELIINTEMVESKIEYYLKAYDDDMRLKSNQQIQIISWLFA